MKAVLCLFLCFAVAYAPPPLGMPNPAGQPGPIPELVALCSNAPQFCAMLIQSLRGEDRRLDRLEDIAKKLQEVLEVLEIEAAGGFEGETDTTTEGSETTDEEEGGTTEEPETTEEAETTEEEEEEGTTTEEPETTEEEEEEGTTTTEEPEVRELALKELEEYILDKIAKERKRELLNDLEQLSSNKYNGYEKK